MNSVKILHPVRSAITATAELLVIYTGETFHQHYLYDISAVMQKLMRCGCCKAINDSLSRQNYRMSDVGIPEIWHFIYKSRSTSQLTSPDYSAPYNLAKEQTRLFEFYQWVHSRMHSAARPLKILFHVGKYESILGWVRILMFSDVRQKNCPENFCKCPLYFFPENLQYFSIIRILIYENVHPIQHNV